MLQTVMNYGKKCIPRIEAMWGQAVPVAANMILITQERHKGAGVLFAFVFSCGPIRYYVQHLCSDQSVKFAVFFPPLWLILAYARESYYRLELWGLQIYGSSSMGLINKYKKSSNGNALGHSLKRSKEFSGIWVPSCSGNHNGIAQDLKWW